ncbi:hypothetical protein ONJ16_27485, partial [Salmonella enterica subsp. enterica serovar Montevideo]|nr:hypothetical protein [Salmonella enterica subsp. enterica serovar Montevideo]
NFSLVAVNLDQKQPGFPEHILPAYLEQLGVEYKIVEENTYGICERLRLFKTTGVNGGEPEFAGFMGGVDKLARDPVSPNYSET